MGTDRNSLGGGMGRMVISYSIFLIFFEAQTFFNFDEVYLICFFSGCLCFWCHVEATIAESKVLQSLHLRVFS